MLQRRRFGFVSQFHRWFFFKFAVYAVGLVLLIAIAMMTWFQFVTREFVKVAPYIDTEMLTGIQASLSKSFVIGLILIAFLLLIALLMIALLGQRISGPLHAISRDLDRIRERKERLEIRLRKDDLFSELAEKINQTFDLSEQSNDSIPKT